MSEVVHDMQCREVEELRASRARVVAAADAERRRIERKIHDGAQQHLVAVAVNLQLARQLVDSDPDAVGPLLEEMGGDVRAALRDVRALAQEVYPPLLLDRGLADALRSAAAASAMRASVQTATLDRHAPDVEATAYFCCVEALRQSARRAGPGARATIRLWQVEATLHFEVVVDDVEGGPPGSVGEELIGISDRLGALGGALTVTGQPGRGTSICGRIPLGRRPAPEGGQPCSER